MLDRLILICLLGVVLVSVPWTEANAKKKCAVGSKLACKSIGGTKVCSCWKTGSEVCETEIKGLGNFGGCTQGVNCPVVTCSVFGTADLGDGMCDPDTLDPDCGIQGIAYCVNPVLNPSRIEKKSIILDTVLTDTSNITRCERREIGRDGRHTKKTFSEGCTEEVELIPDDCPDCCVNRTSELITFTATKFNGVACVCPGGYSDEGECCADSERYYGCCVNPGEEVCIAQQCKANLARYTPGTSIPYSCIPLPDVELQ